jgi:predicted nucleic acid-binding protein
VNSVRAGNVSSGPPTVDIVMAASALENDETILHVDRHFEAIARVFELRQTYAAALRTGC